MRCIAMLALSVGLGACGRQATPDDAAPLPADYYGTTEPFASEAIYFVMTDRFVNGDPSNDQRDQGGVHPTFDRPVPGAPPGESDNIGYLGGDFRGVLDHVEHALEALRTAVVGIWHIRPARRLGVVHEQAEVGVARGRAPPQKA